MAPLLGTALIEATQDSEIKEFHFTSPITLPAAQRPAKVPRWDPPSTPSSSNTFYGGKTSGGKGKGAKGKKGKQNRSYASAFLPGTKLELITHTPDGQEICYRYNMKGKKPIRSPEFPAGFPWLTDKKRCQAQQGTELAEKTWELAALAMELGSYFLSEFPEALGATDTGVPASFWQMQQFTDLLAQKGMRTFASYQCEFGGATPKPTRFLSDLEHFGGNIYFGVPCFDAAWNYQGPLPRKCLHPGQHDAR
eukprot:s1226_g20.t2